MCLGGRLPLPVQSRWDITLDARCGIVRLVFSMISIATFSELVASLHAGPFEDESWQRFLTLLCESTQTASGVFLCHTHSDGSPQILAGGGLNFSQESYDLYNSQFAARDPYLVPFQRNPRAGVIDGDELLPREQLKKTEFFNDLLDRFDLHYSTLLPLPLLQAKLKAY